MKFFFKCVKNKSYQQWTLLKTGPYNKIVTITVGLVEIDDTGDLKYVQGKRLSVTFLIMQHCRVKGGS